jgi:hypothetical protein
MVRDRFAFANLDLLKPGDAGKDRHGLVGVDHLACTYASLDDLLDNYEQLKKRGIRPYWCVHHGVTASTYYKDPDGNQMEFQVESFASTGEADEFMSGPAFAANPIGVEYDPDEWLAQKTSGVPPSRLPVRTSHEPVSPIRGALGEWIRSPGGRAPRYLAANRHEFAGRWTAVPLNAACDCSPGRPTRPPEACRSDQ